MKKFLALIMALLMMLSLVACGSDAEKADTDADEEVENDDEEESKDVEGEDEKKEDETTTEAETTTEVETTEVNNEAVIAQKLELYKDEIAAGFAGSDFSDQMEFSIKAEGNGIVMQMNMFALENLSDADKAQLQAIYDAQKAQFKSAFEMMQVDIPEAKFIKVVIGDKNGDVVATVVIDENTVVETITAEKYVELYGETFLEGVEEGLASTGYTCTSSIKAEGNGVVVQMNVNEFTAFSDEQKAALKANYESEALQASWEASFSTIQAVAPEVEFMKIVICDGNGSIIAEVVTGNAQ